MNRQNELCKRISALKDKIDLKFRNDCKLGFRFVFTHTPRIMQRGKRLKINLCVTCKSPHRTRIYKTHRATSEITDIFFSEIENLPKYKPTHKTRQIYVCGTQHCFPWWMLPDIRGYSLRQREIITKTRLFKYIENVTTKKLKVFR